MSTLSVEYAKSSRSTCKACKNKIEKGSVRIGTHSTFDDRTMTQWRCLDCFSVTKKWKDTDPETIDGFDDLDENDQDAVVEHFEQGGKKGKKSTVVQKKTTKANPKKKKKEESDEEDISDAESFDSNEIQGYTKEQYQQYTELLESLQKKKQAELKNLCQINNQKISGSKPELIERVADGMVLGQIPRCIECMGGKLKFDYKRGMYRCPGYMDDDEMINCNKKFNMDEIEREEWIDTDF